MAITEEKQLSYVKERFSAKIEEIETLADMMTFITNITPASVKLFLQTKLQETADEIRDSSGQLGTLADDVEALLNSL